jgi:RimJ/RimL family protein N-acetyltransferase
VTRAATRATAVAIRRAVPADAAGLVELARHVAAEPEGWLLTTAEWRSAADERRYLKALRGHADAAVFVAEVDGQLVARLSLARDLHPASRHVADLGLLVARTHRRRGIGAALVDRAVGWARAGGVRKLELHVFPHNEPALALYTRCGFRREGYRRGHYRREDGTYADAVLMALDLTARPR